MKSYEQKYKAALEWMQGMYGGLHGKTKEEAEKYFPELQKSEDEKIRKEFCKDIWNYIPYEKAHKYIAWLEKQGEQKPKWTEEDEKRLQSCISEQNCKNDTILDLLNKMPSCITVDGIDYHFVMKKTSIYLAYYACYNGNGERGNAIFGITANSPIDLLAEMLEHLKKKGLLK